MSKIKNDKPKGGSLFMPRRGLKSDITQLLTDLARTPSLVCTVSRDGAVSELFLDGAPQKIEFADPWATIEFKSWHIHVDLSLVTQVRFTEAPGHDNSVSAFAAFDDSQGKSVLRFYFPHPSHTYKTYTAEELALFERFKERYEGLGARD